MSTILIGEDEPEVRGYFELALKCLGYGVELAEDGEEVLEHLRHNHQITAVLLDVMMPRKNGIETLREIRRIHSDLPVIMVSDASSTTTVVEAMRCGATDFLGKPVIHDDLKHALRKASQRPAIVSEDIAASKQAVFYGANDGMESIQRLLRTVAMSDAPVLILGETGSGKEVLARELHANSRRAGKPFLKLNCAALPSELVESELFGYERGAFTGAFQKKIGMFELANSGTILLDEIGDMDFKLQAKLLQVLQDQEFHRIGGKELIHVDVRVIAATHQDLERAIFNRVFREDLYYRLNVMNFRVPPLRERPNDIVSLAEFLVRKYAEPGPTLSPILKQTLLAYHWPGNVRELDNIMRRLTVLQDQDIIIREIQTKVAQNATAVSTVAVVAPVETAPVLDQVIKATHQAESNAILAALNATRWNRKQAAAILKIDYKALLYKMKKLGIEGGQPRAAMTRKSTGNSLFTANI